MLKSRTELWQQFESLLTHAGVHQTPQAKQLLAQYPEFAYSIAPRAFTEALNHDLSGKIKQLTLEFMRSYPYQPGQCVTACNDLMHWLEANNVWCYAMSGSLEIWSKQNDFESVAFSAINPYTPVGHHWVVAPPYLMIDVSLWNNHFVPELKANIPKPILLERVALIQKPSLEALVAGELTDLLKRQMTLAEINQALGHDIHRFWQNFPAVRIEFPTISLEYTPVQMVLSSPQPHQMYKVLPPLMVAI
jgi:hypothetical protein